MFLKCPPHTENSPGNWPLSLFGPDVVSYGNQKSLSKREHVVERGSFRAYKVVHLTEVYEKLSCASYSSGWEITEACLLKLLSGQLFNLSPGHGMQRLFPRLPVPEMGLRGSMCAKLKGRKYKLSTVCSYLGFAWRVDVVLLQEWNFKRCTVWNERNLFICDVTLKNMRRNN